MATDNDRQDELDRIVNAALAKYAAVEPRTGLEERVLANLRAEQARDRDSAWFRWRVIAALAAIAVVAIALALKSGRPSHPTVARHAPASVQMPNEGPNGGSGGVQVRPQVKAATQGTTGRRSRPQAVIAGNPKLDQFPSPQPLSEQEKILTNYVARYPDHAALIAQARTEALREDRIEELRDAAAGSEQDTQHQDR